MSRKLVHHSTYFSLFYCFTDINDCIGVSCSGNGNCSDRVDGYICFCNSGFFGINCEVGKASHLIQQSHQVILENLLILNYFHNINLFLDIHNSDTILLGPSTNNAYMYYPLPFLLSPPLHSTPVTQATQSVGMYTIATANTQGSRFLGPIIAESPKRI